MNYLGTSYGVLRKEKCTGDPVRRLGNDLVFQQLAEVEPRNAGAEQSEENRLHLPALRAHHSGRLEGVRHAAGDRASQRVSGSASAAKLPPVESRGKDRLITIPAIWAAIAMSTTSRAGCHSAGTARRSSALASAASAAEPAVGSLFSAKKPAQRVSHVRGPRTCSRPAQPPSALPAPSATPCFAMRWPQRAKARRNLLDIAQLAARGLPAASQRRRR